MNIDINTLIDLVENIGILAGAIIGASTIIIGGFFKIRKLIKSYRENNHGIKLLTNHFYFKRMRFYLYNHIHNLHFENEDIRRNYASKTFIYDKIYTFYSIFLALAEEIEKTKKLDSIGGMENMLEVIYKGVRTYEDAAVKHGVPRVLVTKFSEFHQNKVESVAESIESIINNTIYDSIEERFSAILDILIGAFTMIMPHISETLDSLNGELSKALNNISNKEFTRLKIYSKRRLK